jgi:hypothetical protein
MVLAVEPVVTHAVTRVAEVAKPAKLVWVVVMGVVVLLVVAHVGSAVGVSRPEALTQLLNPRKAATSTERYLARWRPRLDVETAHKAITIAKEVALRFKNRDTVVEAIARAKRQTGFLRSVHWAPHSIAQGDAGLALMAGYLDSCFPGEDWDRFAHERLQVAVKNVEQGTFQPGLFSGLGSLNFTAWYLSRGGTRYQNLLKSLDVAFIQKTTALCDSLCLRGREFTVHQWDLISGLTGTVAYLLERQNNLEVEIVLKKTLLCLIELTRLENGLPRWHTPAQLIADENMKKFFPYGNINCGLAHGVPGPLAIMSLAKKAGIEVSGLTQAIEAIVDWLSQNRCDDAWGLNWPTAVPIFPKNGILTAISPDMAAEDTDSAFSRLGPTHAAWCYGSPGIARSLWLAGDALDRVDYRNLALDGINAVIGRPISARQLRSATFCHGTAGLLQIMLRFAHDTSDPGIIDASKMLGRDLINSYDPDSLLGYQAVETNGGRVDQAGLLDGAPGVVMVLLAASMEIDPIWDRIFLLA